MEAAKAAGETQAAAPEPAAEEAEADIDEDVA